MRTAEDRSFVQQMQRIELLLQEAEQLKDPSGQTLVRAVVQAIMEIHGAGLARILDLMVQAGDAGRVLFGSFAADPLVTNLLLLHDIHPQDAEARVRQALEQVSPVLQVQGGSVELLAFAEGVVRLRVKGSGSSCSSGRTLRQTVEEAITLAAPELTIEIEEDPPPRQVTFIPVEELTLLDARGTPSESRPPQ